MTEEQRKKLCADLNQEAHKRLGLQTAVTCANAAKEIENLDAARLNAEYQRDTALAELKDANSRIEGLAKRVEALEGRQEAMGRM